MMPKRSRDSVPSAQRAAGCVIGRDYPAPLVDHAAAVREAKRRLAAVRGAPGARAEARGVARRHGSRRDRRGAMQQDPVRRSLAGDATATTDHAPGTIEKQHLLPFFIPNPAESSDDGPGDTQSDRV